MNGICAPWWKDWPTPRAIIFDLDNCLASAVSFESEIDAGNRLGMRTVRAGVQRIDHAIYHITSLAELKHFFVTPAN